VKAKVASLLTNLRAEPVVKGRRQDLFDSSQLKGWGDLGGVKAAAREQSVTEQLEKSFPSTGEIPCSEVGPITERGKWADGGRTAEGSVVARSGVTPVERRGPAIWRSFWRRVR
jgi:hypothetical protein